MSRDVLGLTATIVAAHIRHNQVTADALPALIRSVYRSLVAAGSPGTTPATPTPAVPVKRSVFPEFLVCLEDGQKLKLLKRHLKRRYGMTPADYRAKWGLPQDYPMVAPSYARRRSTLPKSIGFGRKRLTEMSGLARTQADAPEVPLVPARGSRG